MDHRKSIDEIPLNHRKYIDMISLDHKKPIDDISLDHRRSIDGTSLDLRTSIHGISFDHKEPIDVISLDHRKSFHKILLCNKSHHNWPQKGQKKDQKSYNWFDDESNYSLIRESQLLLVTCPLHTI